MKKDEVSTAGKMTTAAMVGVAAAVGTLVMLNPSYRKRVLAAISSILEEGELAIGELESQVEEIKVRGKAKLIKPLKAKAEENG